jgi:hypothetical protein
MLSRSLRSSLLLTATALLLLVVPVRAFAMLAVDDPSWHLHSSSDGNSLYRSSVPGTNVVPVKATMSIPGTIEEVSLVLEDIPRRKEWIGTRTESVLLQKESPYEQTEYLRVHLPWPVQDRSAVIRALISVSDDKREATIACSSINSPLADSLPVLVRAQVHESTFHMTQQAGQVNVVALVFIDPCGWIPKWIVNYFAGRVARSTFADLRKQVAKNLYSRAQRNEMHERIQAYNRGPARAE